MSEGGSFLLFVDFESAGWDLRGRYKTALSALQVAQAGFAGGPWLVAREITFTEEMIGPDQWHKYADTLVKDGSGMDRERVADALKAWYESGVRREYHRPQQSGPNDE